MAKDRFEKVYTQGIMNTIEIWVDKQAGVNYMYYGAGIPADLPHCWIKTASRL